MTRACLRTWRRSAMLTAQFSSTIALGMGGAAALVSLMLALGYQPLPFHEPGRLVAVWERAESGAQVLALSGPDLADFADATHNTFVALGAFLVPRVWLEDPRGAIEVTACYIQAGVFSNLGIRPVLGREVRPDDEPLIGNATPPAWISYEFWQTRYGGSSSAIDATVSIAGSASGGDKTNVRIVGVLPRRVGIPLPFMQNATDIWYLLPPNLADRPRQAAVFFGLGRLRPGASVAQAEVELAAVAQRLGQRFRFDRGKRPVVQGLEAIAQGPARQTMSLLVLGVGLAFLLGCVNLTILMGVEGRQRQREIAIRAALGAGLWRLWREMAAEKSLLTALSLALGVAFAPALLRALVWLVPAAGLGPPLLPPPPLHLGVLLGFAVFALAAALVWAAVVVAVPYRLSTSRALAVGGGEAGYSGRSDPNARAGRWWLLLPTVQTCAGICLLAAAAMTAGAYAARSAANLGPAPRSTLLLSLTPRDDVVLTDLQAADFNRQVLSRFERIPGTAAVALADLFPPLGFPVSFSKRGDSAEVERTASWPMSVSPGYFRTLGIPILYGRGFDETDNARSEKVAIISLDMVRRNWTSPGEVVDSEIAVGAKSRYKIVGVAANFTGYWSQEPFPTIYVPEAQTANWCGQVILRTVASTNAIASLSPQLLAGMANPAVISDISTMQARWQATLTRPLARMAGMLLVAFLGLSLSIQGMYVVAAGSVAARGHELAVCSALGASPSRLAWSAMGELFLAVMLGTVLGTAAALVLRPLLERSLGPVAVWQSEAIAVAVVVLGLAAAAGCWVPTRAAMRANPAELLRQG